MNCLQEQHSRCNSGSGGFHAGRISYRSGNFCPTGRRPRRYAFRATGYPAPSRNETPNGRHSRSFTRLCRLQRPSSPPADPTKATSTAGAGLIDEGRHWRSTLGHPRTAGNRLRGRRYTYRVRTEFADLPLGATIPTCTPTPLPALATFALCSAGNITVSGRSQDIATNLPAIVVSPWQNGLGAYLQDGTLISGASGEELEMP